MAGVHWRWDDIHRFALIFLQQLLECNKCRNSYHPECLGPNYPTKPTKKKKVWVSTHNVNFQELSWGWAVGLAHVIRRISCLTEEEPFQSRSQLWKWIFLRSSEIRDIKNKKFQLTFHLFQICTKCVRCKSCGSTTPGKGWDAQWSHDFSLCHDCAKLFAKGNSDKLA